MSDTSISLSLEGVGKTFQGRGATRIALRDIDLTIERGEIVAVVGASGCGKSTLLRIIAGLERGHVGVVRAGGMPVAGPGRDRGMVFQEHRLLPWLTLADNVAFGLGALSEAERAERVSEHLALVGLAGREHAYPHQLSGGMAQRAALARALASKPGVLLLDEPFGALDAFTKAQLQGELLRIRAVDRPTLVIVTHDIEEAVFLADRIVVLSSAPGTIQRVMPVTLQHPRERTSEEFGRLRRAVLREFFEQSAVPEESHDPSKYPVSHRSPALDPAGLLGERETRGDSPRLRHV